MITIWYNDNVPPEIMEVLEPVIRAEEHILPTWMHEITVHYAPEEENACTIGGLRAYRIASLTVSGCWLRAGTKERADIIRHEFVHVSLSIMTNWVKDLIERLVKDDERLGAWLAAEWQERLEGATCDIEYALRQERLK